MLITRLALSGDPADDGDDVHALLAIQRRAEQLDQPHEPPTPFRWVRASWAYGEYGEPTQTWVLRAGDRSSIAGGYNLAFPTTDNTHLAVLKLFVDPQERRQGYGRALLDHAVEQVRAAKRRLVLGETTEDSPGPAFAKAIGAEPGLREPTRVLDLTAVDPTTHAALLDDARRTATGYSLLYWTGRVPEEHLDGAITAMSRMSDAPLEDLDMEDEVWTRQRYRAMETGQQLRGMRPYTVAARHDASGTLAGRTTVCLAPEQPGWAHQNETVVIPEHRGHRLGLLMKLSMLEWLAEREPAVTRIVTGNAASNSHMIRINEQMGYQVFDHCTEWQLRIS